MIARHSRLARVARLLSESDTWTHKLWHDLSTFARDQGLRLIIIVLGAVIAVRVVRIVLARLEMRLERRRPAGAPPRRLVALFDILNYLSVGVVAGVCFMTALSVLGVDTGALLASAGVAGFAIGFGAQTLVKDLLSGLFLLAEGQYTIGDTVVLADVTGVVERVTLRTTTLRADNGDVHIVPSGEIRRVTNRSRGWSRVVVDVAVPGAIPVSRAIDVLEECIAALAEDDAIANDILEPPQVLGIEDAKDDHVLVRVAVKVTPGRRLVVARIVRRRVFDCFEQNGLAPPIAPSPHTSIIGPS